MRRLKLSTRLLLFALAMSASVGAHAAASEHVRFKVGVTSALAPQPVSGRLLIFMTSQTKPSEMIEPDFLS
ncbi:MAG TPA: hypothetical protein VEV81_05405, partial [Pyrinomonadaceae bacterium]|nr:hypothetical protein [Pyrinomonadaceae bacterium]